MSSRRRTRSSVAASPGNRLALPAGACRRNRRGRVPGRRGPRTCGRRLLGGAGTGLRLAYGRRRDGSHPASCRGSLRPVPPIGADFPTCRRVLSPNDSQAETSGQRLCLPRRSYLRLIASRRAAAEGSAPVPAIGQAPVPPEARGPVHLRPGRSCNPPRLREGYARRVRKGDTFLRASSRHGDRRRAFVSCRPSFRAGGGWQSSEFDELSRTRLVH